MNGNASRGSHPRLTAVDTSENVQTKISLNSHQIINEYFIATRMDSQREEKCKVLLVLTGVYDFDDSFDDVKRICSRTVCRC